LQHSSASHTHTLYTSLDAAACCLLLQPIQQEDPEHSHKIHIVHKLTPTCNRPCRYCSAQAQSTTLDRCCNNVAVIEATPRYLRYGCLRAAPNMSPVLQQHLHHDRGNTHSQSNRSNASSQLSSCRLTGIINMLVLRIQPGQGISLCLDKPPIHTIVL